MSYNYLDTIEGKPRRTGTIESEAKRLAANRLYTLSGHCMNQMKGRGITEEDCVSVLKHGEAVKPPEWNSREKCHYYSMDGNDIDGRRLRIVFTFYEENVLPDMLLLIITAIDL